MYFLLLQLQNKPDQIKQTVEASWECLPKMAKEWNVSYDLLHAVKTKGKLPVVNFAAGGIATPADASLMMVFIH